MKRFIFLLFLIYFSQFTLADITINELMYNPADSDNNKEFIELYHDEWTNLSNYTIGDESSNDSLQLIYFYNSSYSLIVEEDFNYSEINASVYSAGKTIGNNLNDDDNITVYYPNGTVIDYLSYSSSWGGENNGYSLEKKYPYNNNMEENWAESIYVNGTPGRINSRYINESEEIEIDYSALTINEFLADPEGDDDAAMPYGEWVEIYNQENYSIDLEGLMLTDSADSHELYVTDTNTEGTTIKPNGYLVVYRNGEGDFSLNNEGLEEVKLYDKEGNLIEAISYSDSKEGSSWAIVNDNWQQTMPTPNEDNIDSSEVNSSNFTISEVYDLGSDDKAKFGQIIRVKTEIYKGDSAKNSIQLWVEDEKGNRISKESKTNIYTRYADYSLTLPIQLIPNCDYNFEDDNYTIVMEGLDKTDTKAIRIDGITSSLCEFVEVEKDIEGKIFEYELIEAPSQISAGEEFKIKLKLINNDKEIHKIDVWSYVYRGSISYSGEREENKKNIVLPKTDSVVVELENLVKDAQPGDYKLKVRIRKDSQKTVKELTTDIKIAEKANETIKLMSCNEILLSEGINSSLEKSVISGDMLLKSIKEPKIVYESANIKVEKLIPLFIIALLTIFCVVLIQRR
ncbi:lamin tail domain-containing protein [Candidatus Woesearchaeota archaeon]|nr:lamin tail domain-containing protein [Candidatus Woesearchaeota archaeon]